MNADHRDAHPSAAADGWGTRAKWVRLEIFMFGGAGYGESDAGCRDNVIFSDRVVLTGFIMADERDSPQRRRGRGDKEINSRKISVMTLDHQDPYPSLSRCVGPPTKNNHHGA